MHRKMLHDSIITKRLGGSINCDINSRSFSFLERLSTMNIILGRTSQNFHPDCRGYSGIWEVGVANSPTVSNFCAMNPVLIVQTRHLRLGIISKVPSGGGKFIKHSGTFIKRIYMFSKVFMISDAIDRTVGCHSSHHVGSAIELSKCSSSHSNQWEEKLLHNILI